ncbi:MAG: carbamoyltransferase HypF [Bacteroidetes bacterium]|nr:carbamoyltransferase HypF [Bacteroidota bacterium]
MKSKRIRIKGLVQGVGFRPFIYLLANKHHIHGWIENRNDGVLVLAEGTESNLKSFIQKIPIEAPLASNIFSIDIFDEEFKNHDKFQIVKSKSTSAEITEISPDIAVCELCLKDIKQQEHRLHYPLVNCTHCGPRFSIIKDLPYDRHKTTMDAFPMCSICEEEYTMITNRRFHAQPVACNTCGPAYLLEYQNREFSDIHDILEMTSNLIDDGKIIAIKGQGGFHLACDATQEEAVSGLRKHKIREGKPFAVMIADIKSVSEYAYLNGSSKNLLSSWQRPIVLLESKKKTANSVCNELKTIGVMLPYMPFHYLLFEKLKTNAIVLTSGNVSNEPIIIENEKAKNSLSIYYDALITYNRDIYNRSDDSVAFVANEKSRLVRRSRGFAPSPIYQKANMDGIFAAGAELENCFAIGKGEQVILSQHIGDLKNLETLEFYAESIDRYKKLYRWSPSLAVADLHPDYLSTKYAKELNISFVQVQHHHAHIASCMAEHGLDEMMIGVSFDGTGLGDDGQFWGGEFLVCDLNDYQRITHFDYVPIPGGDKAIYEPWRTAVSYLYQYYKDDLFALDLDFLKNIPREELLFIIDMIKTKINSPLSSSAGRLFDGVSALLQICRKASFHAEAPMLLESIIDQNESGIYAYDPGKNISFKATFQELIQDIKNKIALSKIAAKFHNTIIQLIFGAVKNISEEYNLNKVVLSGGCFQNKYILERVERKLIEYGFDVYTHSKIPSNDGGIALGQIAIAAKKRELGLIK